MSLEIRKIFLSTWVESVKDLDLESQMEEVRSKLKEVLGLDDDTGIFLTNTEHEA